MERIGAGWLASRQGKRMPWAEGRYSRAGDGIYVQEEKTSEDGDEGIFFDGVVSRLGGRGRMMGEDGRKEG